jgi:trans-aconitate 2-methyltransferase
LKREPAQAWDAALYDSRHAFVHAFGASLIDLLAPAAGERILDLGCGTGHLTAKIAAAGAVTSGIDASPAMIEQARKLYPELSFEVADATDFHVETPLDAVFSNAALHWIKPPAAVVSCVARALKPGGRFVAELGGRGNVGRILDACRVAISRAVGCDVADVNPWYFPSVAEYASLLESNGLEVRLAELFDRPTPLEEGDRGMHNWLAMFGGPCFAGLPEEQRPAAMAEAERLLRGPLLEAGQWTADYRRLRVSAAKVSSE